ncbi:Caspase-7 [Bulinus truncatus]|nr:Caspase-7 [Bulinus truncatus]
MEQKDKDIIRRNYSDLASAIKPLIQTVTKDLFLKNILTERMYEEIIEAHRTATERAEALLDRIPRRGPTAFNELYNSVLKCELYEAANILKPDINHWQLQITEPTEGHNSEKAVNVSNDMEMDNGDDDDDIVLPDRWPLDAPTTEPIVQNVVENSNIFKIYKKSLGSQRHYKMKNSPRGRALIINNLKFQSLSDRQGSELDESGLISLFKQLDFDVVVENDKTCAEMKQILKNESERDHSKFNCFVLVILSHGFKGGVFGTDGKVERESHYNYISLKGIKDMFDVTKTLIDKPKLFFIQACRGVNKNEGRIKPVEVSDGDDLTLAEELFTEVNETLESLIPTEEADDSTKVPHHADFYIAMSTTSDMASIRNTLVGTWFMQALIYVFANYASRCNIHELMQLVNQLVSKAESKKGLKQVAEMRHTLTKELYFFPGLTHS